MDLLSNSMSIRGASGLMLQRRWQMMGALEAVDGILLFGVSAAYIFAVMQAYWSMLAARVTPAVTHPVTHISGECERQESRTTPQ